MQIKELQDGMKRVNLTAKIVEVGSTREVHSRFKDETYQMADAVIADETGTVKLTLWNEQIQMVRVGAEATIENAYVTSFKSEIQVNIGKFGKLTVEA